MSPLRVPFFFSGGWAIELHLGRVTRAHHDIDVLVMRRDQRALHLLKPSFVLKKIIPHPEGLRNRGTLAEWREDEWLELPVHQMDAFRRGEDEVAFQIMLAESDDTDWIFRRNPKVRMLVARMGFHPLWGLPYLAPEIVLLFKAKYPDEERNRLDFERAATHLSIEARRWLRDAIARTHPEHEWLKLL